ncbi:MAG TPA: threonine synthase [Candidatus Kaiserbacteria bacterium]|nr:threonine synthase [Candidatus Kaiserbacteria bacterium]
MVGRLISTRDKEKKSISYTDALLNGLAPDGGLYVPTEYPQLTKDDLIALKSKSYLELAFEIKKKFVGNAIPDAALKVLLQNAYTKAKFHTSDGNFVPLRQIGADLFLENLSLGPTASFKDIALQQLGQEINYELNSRNKNLVILGATSGDTGSSAEAAVKGLDRIKLFMLSPQVGMSNFQKAQMRAFTGGNIFNISIDGRFDDCQDLVKELKQDPEFSTLGAVNSINWGRISSQVPYFVSGYLQVASEIGQEVDFVVPTGNLGNILSGYIARKIGVPIRKLIVATNENDVMAKLIKTGVYELIAAHITSSPSMDISKVSNYERLVFDFLDRNPLSVKEYMKEFSSEGKVDLMKFGMSTDIFVENGIFQGSSTHQNRIHTIKSVYDEAKTIIDPHTADAVTVAKRYKVDDGVPMIVMETALPVKFEHTINEALGFTPEKEERFKDLESKGTDSSFYNISSNSTQLKEYIRNNI